MYIIHICVLHNDVTKPKIYILIIMYHTGYNRLHICKYSTEATIMLVGSKCELTEENVVDYKQAAELQRILLMREGLC